MHVLRASGYLGIQGTKCLWVLIPPSAEKYRKLL